MINGYAKISNIEDYYSSNKPKVVFREDKRLLYILLNLTLKTIYLT